MKTKLLYVVTSTPDDIYLEQTFLSIYSLRRKMPDAYVVLLTDNRTNDTLTGNRAKILDLISEKIVVDLDDKMNNLRRSRQLKTSMRNLVEGDFLYIDGDTLVCSSLEEIDDCPYDLAAVLDAHRTLDEHYGTGQLRRQATTLGFSVEGESDFFNGGLMFVRDTPQTREFFSAWNANWKDSVDKGINQDQPALIKTNIEMGHPIRELDGSWNCQVLYGFNYFATAKIVHYFASKFTTVNGGYTYDFVDPHTFAAFKQTWEVSDELERKLDRPFSCFSPQCELIGGIDVAIHNTHVYKVVRLIYLRAPRLFGFLQAVLYRVNKVNKKRIGK